MDILPINFVHPDDLPLIGVDLANLAKLYRAKLPVPEAILVFPPNLHFETTLTRHEARNRDVFEQRLTIIRQEIFALPVPEALITELAGREFDPAQVWRNLLEKWLEQVRSKVHREGFLLGATFNLLPQPVFFSSRIIAQGNAYFDSQHQDTSVQILTGKLSPLELEEVDQLVIKANKVLVLPQVYYWVVDLDDQTQARQLYLIKVIPFTDNFHQHQSPVDPDSIGIEHTAALIDQPPIKTTTQIYLNPGSRLVVEQQLAGVVLPLEQFAGFDQKVFRLTEYAISLPEGKVLAKLSDLSEPGTDIRGCYRLIHQTTLLKEDVEAILFVRNKKKLPSVQVGIPFTRSTQELMILKKELAVLGLHRRANCQFWLEIAVLENLVNLDGYIKVGIDGVILDLDQLAGWLFGYSLETVDQTFYLPHLQTLVDFLVQPIKTLHSEKVPILLTGQLLQSSDLLAPLMAKGIGGVVVSPTELNFVRDHLSFMEKRLFKKLPVANELTKPIHL